MMPIVRAIRKFKRLKFRTKLIIYYFILIMIPTIMISYIYFRTSSAIIVKNASASMQQLVKKNNQFTDMVMSRIQDQSLSLLADPDLYHLFNRAKPTDLLELLKMDRQASEILNKYFGSEPYVDSVQLATSYYSFGGTASLTTRPTFVSVSPIKLQSSELYQETVAAGGQLKWFPTYDFSRQFDQSELADMDPRYRYVFSAARIMKSSIIENGVIKGWQDGNEAPLLLINFNESFFRTLLSKELIDDQSYMFVISKEGTIIAHPDTRKLTRIESPEWLKQAASGKADTAIVNMSGQKMLICYDSSAITGWITVLVVPYQTLISNLPIVNMYSIYIAIILIAASIFLAYMISGWLTKPIKKLLVAFHLAGSGDFTTKIAEQNDLEFGLLISKFNLMTDKIRDLIDENYTVRLREKEAEIMALNLQLNPHFLYNTLNVINWMALDKDQDAISKMIVSLSTMLQYAVKNKKELVCFQDDLTWLKSYMHIMENRYYGIFEAVYQLDAAPPDAKVPKMFLQPIIENAIIHGFAATNKGGVIRISGQVRQGALVFTVEDNGKGMDGETLATIMKPDAAGVGIINVQNRIRLLFGEAFGLHIRSEVNAGTSVSITLPYPVGD